MQRGDHAPGLGEKIMRANVVTEKLIAKCACTNFNIGVVSVAPMSGPPLHVNAREDEWFHVLDGEITFQVGQERLVAGPGASIFAWRGVPHGFQNLTADTATVLQMVTPEDLENRLFIAENGKELDVSALRQGWFGLHSNVGLSDFDGCERITSPARR